MLVKWQAEDIRDFLRQALDFLVKRNHMYPAIRLAAFSTTNREETQAVAEKLRMIKDLAESYPL